MQDKKHLEFKVTEWKFDKGEFVILRKEPTQRGAVMITERDAMVNNAQTQFTKLWYETVKEETDETKKVGRPAKAN